MLGNNMTTTVARKTSGENQSVTTERYKTSRQGPQLALNTSIRVKNPGRVLETKPKTMSVVF